MLNKTSQNASKTQATFSCFYQLKGFSTEFKERSDIRNQAIFWNPTIIWLANNLALQIRFQ